VPRIRRGLVDNGVYHVINRGNGRQEIFHKEKDYEAFIHILQEAKERYSVKLYAYCLMPNHYHMAMAPAEGEYLSRCMQWMMTSHVRKYHRHYGGSGHVWQGRYKSFMVQEDSHLQMVMRYIEGNPVRARMTASAKEWKWSSHREVAGGRNGGLIDRAPIDLPEEWTRYVDEPLEDTELVRLRASVNRQSPFGNATWQMKMSRLLGLESTLRKRGRPRKGDVDAKK